MDFILNVQIKYKKIYRNQKGNSFFRKKKFMVSLTAIQLTPLRKEQQKKTKTKYIQKYLALQ